MPPGPKLDWRAFCRISLVGQVYAEFLAVKQYPTERSIRDQSYAIAKVCAPDTTDSFDVRVCDVPLAGGRGSNDLGAITGIFDIAFDPEIFISPDGLDEPAIMFLLEDPLRTAKLVSTTLPQRDDWCITAWLGPLWSW